MNFDESSRLFPERGSGRSLPVTTPLEKALLGLVTIVVIVAIGLTIGLVNVKRTNDGYFKNMKMKQENICLSPSCVTEASNLLKSIDMSVDPCKDFYHFVCGNWIKNNYLASSLETQFTQLTRVIILRVKEILEKSVKEKNLPEHKQKTSDFYKACMDQVSRSIMGAKGLLSDLKKFGGWPIIEEGWNTDFDWADTMVEFFKNGYISYMLFSIKVDVDTKNTSRSLISIGQPSLGLKKEYFSSYFDEVIVSYKNVIYHLAENLNSKIDKEQSMKDIDEAFKIESKLATLSNDVDMRLPEFYYNIVSLEELEASTPKIPWKKILKNLLPPDTELKSDERIMITSPTMMKGLNSLLEELDTPSGKKTLANYMFYRIVFNAANFLSKEFYILISSFYEKPAATQSWELCTSYSMELFPLSLSASYVAKYMDNKTKEELKTMLEDLRKSLIDNIRNAEWLDDKTKEYALLKAMKMKAAVGYDDEIMHDENLDSYYKSVNITADHFSNVKQMIAFKLRQSMEGLHDTRIRFKWTDSKNLLTANAYYLPTENSIIIPVGVLQDTVFSAGRPKYVNYGSLGMIVGHELTHAFDSLGSLYDAEGNYRIWWSWRSWMKYRAKMKCYEKQYSNYYLPEAHAYVNGTLTLGENIADNGGVQTAYYAYRNQLRRIGAEKSLPGLPYNERQMFWISYASVWCRKQSVDSILNTMQHSVHTPSRFRVIGSLSNMNEFSEDFSCDSHSNMNPQSKCFLWEQGQDIILNKK